jgi:sterol desaturase/sphingolipid hydroxylase (fatty acid hydroxylase superfamily)
MADADFPIWFLYLFHSLIQMLTSFVIYVVFAGAFFLLFWVWGRNKMRWRRIQPGAENKPHFFSHDLYFSAINILFSGLMVGFLMMMAEQGKTQIYTDINKYSVLWLPVQFLLVVVVQDSYFYWVHRFMHHPRWFHIIHKVHHKSTDPSPLSIFSFHPFETIIEALPSLILPFIFPLYLAVFLIWQLFDLFNNLFAHLGYEIYPKNWVRIPFLKYKTASTHHNLHHEKFNGNYGLYFTFWDKWMKTEIAEYESKFDKVTGK